MSFPTKVLLDTNVVNFLLDWSDVINDGYEIPPHIPDNDKNDLIALRKIWQTGQRGGWQLAVSPCTYDEIIATNNPSKRAVLENWFNELWQCWREDFERLELSDDHADSLTRRLIQSGILAPLPDLPDRELLAHAVAYGCDTMCTRDRKTIIRHRKKLRLIPVRILTPTEWWAVLSRYPC